MKEVFLIISFGNYESKILISNFNKNKLNPIYKSSFITRQCFDKSTIIDFNLLVKLLNDQIKKIPINISDKNVQIIFNIPIRILKIDKYKSEFYQLNKVMTKEMWNNLLQKSKKSRTPNYLLLDSRCYKLNIDDKQSIKPPYNSFVSNIQFEAKQYLISNNVISDFYGIANKCNLNVKNYVCDSLVMDRLFSYAKSSYKLFINIGHLETSFDLYYNSILLEQDITLFGVKDLTQVISKLSNVDELKSIDFLKRYNDLIELDSDITLVNHFKEKFLDYSQTKIKDIGELVNEWVSRIIFLIDKQLNQYTNSSIKIDEIYLYSSTNVIKNFVDKMKEQLKNISNIIFLESNIIGLSESKYIPLIATTLHQKKELYKN